MSFTLSGVEGHAPVLRFDRLNVRLGQRRILEDVCALLVVPAAAARNFARSAGGMFRWAVLLGLLSAVTGLLLPVGQDIPILCGAAIILAACIFFAVSLVHGRFSRIVLNACSASTGKK